MNKAQSFVCVVALTALTLLALACSGFQQGFQIGKDSVTIAQIGTVYKAYCTANKKGPADANELMKSATTQPEKDAVKELQDGKFTAVWNVNVNDASSGGSSAVLVYWTNPVNNIRLVLMADCTTVTSLQESQFQSATKAKPSTGGK